MKMVLSVMASLERVRVNAERAAEWATTSTFIKDFLQGVAGYAAIKVSDHAEPASLDVLRHLIGLFEKVRSVGQPQSMANMIPQPMWGLFLKMADDLELDRVASVQTALRSIRANTETPGMNDNDVFLFMPSQEWAAKVPAYADVSNKDREIIQKLKDSDASSS